MKKELPSLHDSDIVTSTARDKHKYDTTPLHKRSSLAIALAFTTASAVMFTGCSDYTDCDSDVTTVADAAADSTDVGRYDTGANMDPTDVGSYDTSDADVTRAADTQCD